jgi:hypothetical protein
VSPTSFLCAFGLSKWPLSRRTDYIASASPESAGRAHIVGMIDRFVGKCAEKIREAGEGEITFDTMESVARAYKAAAGF